MGASGRRGPSGKQNWLCAIGAPGVHGGRLLRQERQVPTHQVPAATTPVPATRTVSSGSPQARGLDAYQAPGPHRRSRQRE